MYKENREFRLKLIQEKYHQPNDKIVQEYFPKESVAAKQNAGESFHMICKFIGLRLGIPSRQVGP